MLKANGIIVAQFKREHMAPGEMEHISVPKKLFLHDADTYELIIEEAG